MSYDHKTIEKKWQDRWEADRIFEARENGDVSKKRYVLDMFPYPSGVGLHVGHPEGYTATDIYSRYLRMNSFSVLHPMGWDAFGLPAENYAIKSGVHPDESTRKNIETFTRQIKSLGFSYDWSREVNTSDPDYYRWTQWIFLQLYHAGLAYKKNAPVNWCPSCQTVLANEQVVDGACERCGHEVIQKNLEQWFFNITGADPSGKNAAYPERLLEHLDSLDWPDPIKHMQKNWIGKSEGAEIVFPIVGASNEHTNYVLLHGYEGRPDSNFKPWLKKELEQRGYDVQVPALPNPDNPNIMEQVAYVLEHCTFDEHTILLGHSLGGPVALKVVEALARPIQKLIIAAGFIQPHFRDHARPFEKTFDWTFDFKKIKKNAGSITYLRASNDSAVPAEQADAMRSKMGGTIIDCEAADDHICGTKEPEVLSACVPSIKVFTTRPDTLFGATYMVLAPEHPLVRELQSAITNWKKVESYIKKTTSKSQLERTDLNKEKTGIALEGVFAINPGTGKEIPVWIADYVLSSYGTGAIMAVPAHDERDYEFAKKHALPIVEVIQTKSETPSIESGVLVNSGEFDGMDSEEAQWKITEKVGGHRTTQYRLRDWLISRQRYWGAPIPIIHCDECGEQPVPEKDLPVVLSDDVDFKPTGESPLTLSKKFHDVSCPRCGKDARRESDTMDTFVDSSWYFLRYTDPDNKKTFASPKALKAWMPVDTYVGGAEHAVLHLMYARFVTMALFDLGFCPIEEPFATLRNQGLILGPDGQKMSKSRGNVINPDAVVEQLGADTMRLYEMFMGPLEDAKPWDTDGIIGTRRFLERVWAAKDFVAEAYETAASEKEMKRVLHQTIKKIQEDIESFGFNTAIAQMMIFINTAHTIKQITRDDFETFLKVLNPFAPHLSNELWEALGNKECLEKESWPLYDNALTVADEVVYTVQVNGKVRGTVTVEIDADESVVAALAYAQEKAAPYLEGKTIVKQIFVPGRIINFVVKE